MDGQQKITMVWKNSRTKKRQKIKAIKEKADNDGEGKDE